MSAEFANTNVVHYLIDDDPNAERPVEILGQGPRISLQVLNEAMVNCRRKAGLTWEDTGALTEGIESLCPVEDLTVQTHQVGRALAEMYQLSVYDALIAGCTTLWSEDMHDGLRIENRLRGVNPFA